MKLCAIYNVWDSIHTLKASMLSIRSKVDLYIIVYQVRSNFGEVYDPRDDWDLEGFPVITHMYRTMTSTGTVNEIKKRNIGLQIAREQNCTHFLHIDCDECYLDFREAVEEYKALRTSGSVCRLWTYFKEPTWRLTNSENYHVPFIHKLYPETRAGAHGYPYLVDPTRSVPDQNVVEISHYMHHYSWVRKDIERKVRNSSAKVNPIIHEHLKEYKKLEGAQDVEGYYIESYKDTLTVVPNYFNIQI